MNTRARITYRLLSIAVAALVLGCVFGSSVQGSIYRSGKDIHITNLHRIEDDIYIGCENLTVDGTIIGDLSVGCYNVELTGVVSGSANLAGRVLNHSGRIEGSLRAACERLTINGSIGHSLLGFCSEMSMNKGAVIERDVAVVGNNMHFDGIIKGNVDCAAATARISGLIEGDVTVEAAGVTVAPSAIIRGNLVYVSEDSTSLKILEGGTVVGDVTWRLPEQSEEEPNIAAQIAVEVSGVLAAFLFGIIVVRLFRPYAEEAVHQLFSRASVSFASGLLGIAVLILCILVLAVSLITMLIGTLLLGEGHTFGGSFVLILSTVMIPISSFASVTGGVMLYSGKIVVGFVLGYMIMRMGNKGVRSLKAMSLLIGLAILSVVYAIPYAGAWLFWLVAITGAGAIILGIKNCRKESGAAPGTDFPPAQ